VGSSLIVRLQLEDGLTVRPQIGRRLD
jgi:hypothetical protein